MRSSRRNGCLNCRRRRKKCDEAKPVCGKCAAHGEVCEADDGIIFRSSGIGSDHPSMIHSRNLRTASDYQVSLVLISFDLSDPQQLYRSYMSIWTTKALDFHTTSAVDYAQMYQIIQWARYPSRTIIVALKPVSSAQSRQMTSKFCDIFREGAPFPQIAYPM